LVTLLAPLVTTCDRPFFRVFFIDDAFAPLVTPFRAQFKSSPYARSPFGALAGPDGSWTGAAPFDE
jgi:hypothetical protein